MNVKILGRNPSAYVGENAEGVHVNKRPLCVFGIISAVLRLARHKRSPLIPLYLSRSELILSGEPWNSETIF